MVRITAAEALGRYGSERDAAAALEVLLRYAAPSENAFLNLAAWNSIDYLDERAQPAREVLKSIAPSPVNPPPRWGDYTNLVKRRTLADLQLADSTSK